MTVASPTVVIVSPPGLPGTVPNREGAGGMGTQTLQPDGFRYPPQLVACVTAALRQAGMPVTAIDATAEGLDVGSALARIASLRPDAVAAHVSWGTRNADRAFLAGLQSAWKSGRQSNERPLVVAFGPSASHMVDDLSDADTVLVGEPEGALAELLQRGLCGIRLPRRVSGFDLSLPDYESNGRLASLATVPAPAWDALPIDRYAFLTIQASRGCTGTCSWCPYVVAQGREFRVLAVNAVIDEIARLVEGYNRQRIVFRDPVAAHDQSRLRTLCRGLLRRRDLAAGRRFVWECESRPEHLTPGLLRLMAMAGCVAVKVGVETLSPALLSTTGRLLPGWDARQYKRHIEELVRAGARWGVAVRLFALVGLSGQSHDDGMDVARFCLGLGADLVEGGLTVHVATAYPGTTVDCDVTEDADALAREMAETVAKAGSELPTCGARLRRRFWRVLRRAGAVVEAVRA